jgi:chromosome segregation ATPase
MRTNPIPEKCTMTDPGHVTVSIREYFERIVRELDERLTTAVNSLKELMEAKLKSIDDATKAAFASSEKAIVKAEDAQKDYNVRTNELRGALSDQALRMMTRVEYEANHAALTEKIEAVHASVDKQYSDLKKEIADLRESRSKGGGKEEALQAEHQQSNWRIGLAIGIILSLPSWILALILLFKK